MEKYIVETLKTPVNYECDVLVCGGGTTGFTAALAAARNGARTILIEREGYVGGALINGAGPIHSFFNLYKSFENAERIQVVRGIAQELIDRMAEKNLSPGHLEMEKGGSYDSVITLIDWEGFKDTALQMLSEAGVTVLLHVVAAGAVMEGNAIRGVIIEGKSGREVISAKVVIDTTGDGDVAAFAGAEFVKKHDTTNVGFPFGMSNVDMPKLVKFLEEHDMVNQIIHADKGDEYDDIIRLGFELKKIPVFKEFMDKNGMWGPLGVSLHPGNYNYINSAALQNVDTTNTLEFSKAEIILRHQATTLGLMLKEHIPGFENAYISWTPDCAGVRYTRAIVCEHDMTNDEIVNCARFEDEVMLYGFHDCAPRVRIKDAGYYGIPYRAFIPVKIEGMLVGGRLITTEWTAHMSTRNTGSCLAQGQEIGTAAALCSKAGVTVRNVDMKELQKTLREQGVFLGE